MKLSLLLSFVMIIVGCAKTDDGGPRGPNDVFNEFDSITLSEDSQLLLGKWNLESFNYSGQSITEIFGVSSSSTFTGVGKDINSSLTFTADNIITAEGGYTIELTTAFEGTESSSDIPVGPFNTSGTWVKISNTLTTDVTITANNSISGDLSTEETSIIEELTDTTLRLRSLQSIETLLPTGGSVTTTTNSVLVYKRAI